MLIAVNIENHVNTGDYSETSLINPNEKLFVLDSDDLTIESIKASEIMHLINTDKVHIENLFIHEQDLYCYTFNYSIMNINNFNVLNGYLNIKNYLTSFIVNFNTGKVFSFVLSNDDEGFFLKMKTSGNLVHILDIFPASFENRKFSNLSVIVEYPFKLGNVIVLRCRVTDEDYNDNIPFTLLFSNDGRFLHVSDTVGFSRSTLKVLYKGDDMIATKFETLKKGLKY